MKIFAKIRFYWGALVIAFNTGILMIPAIMIFRKHKSTILHHINRLTLFMIGGKLSQNGTMDPSADMYVMNHQGIIDIIGLEALQNNHLRWVAKKELFETPWYGKLLQHAEMISLDRSNKAGLVKLVKDVKESQEVLNRSVAIFPEGTRSNTQTLLPFKQGTKLIAEKLNLKIQPIVISGSKWLLNEHERTAHNSTVHYTFLDSIVANQADENWYEDLRNTMQKVIDDEYTHHSRSR